ncbi:hypothetical protein AURDEDRAFT_175994 [Auricularia subglabra TFB-10046 SS5]|nr:hypothetical protein AURDEDRAFT_175994 [Auricularia subglabra TFB-10046 SS5]
MAYDEGWLLTTLVIDVDGLVDASLICGDQKCHLLALRGSRVDIARLMLSDDVLRSVVSLTIPAAQSPQEHRPFIPLAGIRLPALEIVTLQRAWPDDAVRTFFESLTAYAFRLRHFALHSARLPHYDRLFQLLRHPTPLLRSLLVSPTRIVYELQSTPRLTDMLLVAPLLTHVHWGHPIFPPALNDMELVTHLRIQFPYGPAVATGLFSLFPRMTSLTLDCSSFNWLRTIAALPPAHPLQSLELCGEPSRPSLARISWEDLDALGYTRIPTLALRNCGLSALSSVCDAGAGALHSLTLEDDDIVHATLSRGTQTCRMHALASELRNGVDVARLMSEDTWLCNLTTLTLSLSISFDQERPFIGGGTNSETRPPYSRGVSPPTLLDDVVLQGLGTIVAPHFIPIRTGTIHIAPHPASALQPHA